MPANVPPSGQMFVTTFSSCHRIPLLESPLFINTITCRSVAVPNVSSLPRGGVSSRRPSVTASISGYNTISSIRNESQEALLPDGSGRARFHGRPLLTDRYGSLPKRTTKDGKVQDDSCPVPEGSGSRHLSEALSALDLDSLDLSNIDPSLASSLLEEIRRGADLGPIIEKIRKSSNAKSKSSITKEKVVTFEDETLNR